MTLEINQAINIDRKELIKSYGFVEQLSNNENFLQESLDIASKISGTGMAYISLLDDNFQYILSQHGSELKTIKIEDSICQFAIKGNKLLVIENTRANELTKNLPQVNKENGIVFYAGCPLINKDNIKVGALCVMDTKAKTLTQTQQDVLEILAKQVMVTLENQRGLIKLIKKINTNFKPAACADLNCLQGELGHLHDEVIIQNKLITDQKLVVENTNKELVNFANMVAHDVRAPLRTINSFIGLHDKELQKSSVPYKKEYLDFIKKAASNLDELTNGLLDYAKSGDESFNNEKLSLSQILETVTFNLTETIESSNAAIVLPEEDFIINGKKLRLIQLFQNLIDNGLKYQDGQEPPYIKIQAKEVENKIRVSIIDNGIGISKDNLRKIFEPFKRLHSAEEYSGSGIGLATCKKIIDNLDSELFVSSELGVGSIFTFDLPK